MYKGYSYLALLGLFVGMVHAVDHNFQIKNNTAQTMYVMVGDKTADPINKIYDVQGNFAMIPLPPKKSAGLVADMKKYPELLISSHKPVPGGMVYYYMLDPYAMQGQNLQKKQMLLEVVEPKKGLTGTLVPQVQPQTGIFGSSISNNVTNSELETTFAIFHAKKPGNSMTDAYNLIPHFNGEWYKGVGPNSSAYEILNVSSNASKDQITEAYNKIINNANYLTQHVDLKDIYNAVSAIVKNARDQALAKAGRGSLQPGG